MPLKYYIDKEGKEHLNIVLITEETKEYLVGWYFEGAKGQLTGPYSTLEEVEEEYRFYIVYLG
jgi:hypothetical protein